MPAEWSDLLSKFDKFCSSFCLFVSVSAAGLFCLNFRKEGPKDLLGGVEISKFMLV